MTGRTPYRPAYVSPRRLGLPAPVPDGEIQLTICFPVERFMKFFEALTIGGEALGYGSLGDHNIDAIAALATMRSCDDTDIEEETLNEIRREVFAVIYHEDEEEEEDDMQPVWEKRDSTWYAGFPCDPCGGREWVRVGVGGALGGGGGVSGRDPSTAYLPDGVSVSGASGASCYGQKATAYFADQCSEMWEWLIDLSITGIEYIDFATPITEFFDAASLVADALSGSGTIRELTQIGIDTLRAIIASPGNIAALKANWTFTTIPTYSQLKAWVDGTTFVDSAATAKKAWQVWALRLIVQKHYAALNVMLAECGTGASLSELTTGGLVELRTVDQIIIYKYTLPNIMFVSGFNTLVAKIPFACSAWIIVTGVGENVNFGATTINYAGINVNIFGAPVNSGGLRADDGRNWRLFFDTYDDLSFTLTPTANLPGAVGSSVLPAGDIVITNIANPPVSLNMRYLYVAVDTSL